MCTDEQTTDGLTNGQTDGQKGLYALSWGHNKLLGILYV